MPYCLNSHDRQVYKFLKYNMQSKYDAAAIPSAREILGDIEWLFILATKMVLGMGITDGKIFYAMVFQIK